MSRTVALATLSGLIAFAVVALGVLWLDERDPEDAAQESALGELIEHFALALGVAAPLGVAVAVIGARWGARRTASRIDELISTTSQVSLDNLELQLPEANPTDELDELARTLNAVVARIAGGIAAQRRFAADASHELRTPLAVMISALEVARRRARTPEEWERVVDDALAEARRLAALAEALLQLTRAAAHAPVAEPLDLDAALATAVARWRPRALAAGQVLELRGTTGAAVDVEAGAFAIAIGNLIDNAIAWSPHGAAIAIEAAATADVVEISVDDSGAGVPEARRARIFEPFTRGDPARPGAGLGLAIVKQVCGASGGSVAVATSERGGARFTMRFPRQR